MSTEAITPTVIEAPRERQAVAPWWHTIVLLLLMLGTSLHGAHTVAKSASSGNRASLLAVTIVWEWLLLLFAWWGLRLRKQSLRAMIGGRWNTPEDAILDVALGIAFMFVVWLLRAIPVFILVKLHKLDIHSMANGVKALAPSNNAQLALGIAASLTAGFVEEIIFRAYLQRQFSAWTRNAAAGIAISAVIFGLSHGYQGAMLMITLAFYGAALGVLAHVRRSLRPGMIAHAAQDSISFLILRFVPGLS
jgi:membrane protease YdiL (CAAX protease family)